ncbi:hypothetical protein [Dactylosporangium sp. NPDC051484]|uniref:hypothetical protein n=1 Tax=Dactylosporangium sp. NPDC051484 TaxID=3154942 RepID=UPI00344E60BD
MGDSPAPLRAGDPATVGPYWLIGVLGVGGMGTVYLAEAPGGHRVALRHPGLARAGAGAWVAAQPGQRRVRLGSARVLGGHRAHAGRRARRR